MSVLEVVQEGSPGPGPGNPLGLLLGGRAVQHVEKRLQDGDVFDIFILHHIFDFDEHLAVQERALLVGFGDLPGLLGSAVGFRRGASLSDGRSLDGGHDFSSPHMGKITSPRISRLLLLTHVVGSSALTNLDR